MVVFGHRDNKYESIHEELKKVGVESGAVKVRHPVLSPFYLLKLLIQRKGVKVYIFRYLNDSRSLFIAYLRVISEILTIGIAKLFSIEIWWLCHNVDKETSSFHPRLTAIRRKNVVNNAKYIFTTNELLVSKAKELFKDKNIDFLSLGYIENGFVNIQPDRDEENNLLAWIQEKDRNKSKFIFCIGSPATKALHFQKINHFIETLNSQSHHIKWYAVVIGNKVNENKYIYNVPYKMIVDSMLIKTYADFYYRILDDYSISYTLFEAANYKIPIITENYGIIPDIINKYNIGIVVDYNVDVHSKLENVRINDSAFESYLNENNWQLTADKIKYYYDLIN